MQRKKEKTDIIKIVLICIFILLTITILSGHSIAIDNEDEIMEKINNDIDENLISNKYLVTSEYISRIRPQTTIDEVKQEWSEHNIKIYKNSLLAEEVVEGYIGTGMALKVDNWKETYTISVIGDMDGDGIANQIELSKIIRHINEIDGCILSGITAVSADINTDGEIDKKDVVALTNYIVFDELDVEDVPIVKEPLLQITEGEKDGEKYTTDVSIKVSEQEDENKINRTVYKIIGTNDVEETIISNDGIINFTENGIYKVSAYTYGVLGNRSIASSLIIRVEKPVINTYHINYVIYDKDNVIENINPNEYTSEGVQINNLEYVKQNTLEREGKFIYGEDYLFKGWYTDNNYTNGPINYIDGSTEGDITLYAKWELVVAKIIETDEIFTSLNDAIRACELNNEKRTILILKDIEESGIIVLGQNITIDLNGRNITSNDNVATIINYGKLQVVDNSNEKEGRIENTVNIAIRNEGTLILGDDDATVERKPEIEGNTYGIDNAGIFEFYDGAVIGISPLRGDVNKTPQNYSPVVERYDNKQKAILGIMADAEARINSINYTRLEDAISEARVGDTVVLLQNKNVSGVIRLPKLKDITLDLNSYSITANYDGDILENFGKLKIIDSSEEKTGEINVSIGNNSAVNNFGVLEFNSGKINTKNLSAIGVKNNIDAQFTLSGGIINIETEGAANLYCVGVQNFGTIYITDGTISEQYNTYSIYNLGGANVEISGTPVIGSTIYNLGNLTQRGGQITELINEGENSNLVIQGGSIGYYKNLGTNALINGGFINNLYNRNSIIVDSGKIEYLLNDYDGNIIINNAEITTLCNHGIAVINNINMVQDELGTLPSIDNTKTYLEESKMTINGGTFNVDSFYNSAILDIEDGNINIGSINGLQNSSIINIGENKEHNDDKPIIIGGNYGVNNISEESIINFNNGVVKGSINAFNGYINQIPENKQIIFTVEDEKETARIGTLENDLFEVNNVGYKKLQDAINLSGTEQTTIKVLDNFNISSISELGVIGENQNIIFNLNGKTIKSYTDLAFIKNYGNLLITDSEEQAGLMQNVILENNKNMTIEKINISYESKIDSGISNKGTFNINSGNIILKNSGKIINNYPQSTFNLAGGSIQVNYSYSTAIYAQNSSNVEISGGKIELSSDAMYATAIEGEGIETEIQEDSSTEELNNTEQEVPSSVLVSGGIIEVNSSGWGVSYSIVSYGNVQITGGLIKGYLGNIEIRSEESDNKIKKGTLIIDSETIEDVNLIEDLTINISEKASGEIIHGKINGKVENRGNLKISGGSILYDYRETISNTGKLEIIGGKVIGDIGIYNFGELILGKKGGDVDKTNPSIEGSSDGIENYGSFKFYDGVLKGKENAFTGSITELEEGYTIKISHKDEENIEIATLNEIIPIAEVNGNMFSNIQDAIDACDSSDEEETNNYTIIILDNLTILSSENSIQIPEGKKVIIDLKGKNITHSNEKLIDNRGNLEIIDSSSTSIEEQGTINSLTYKCIINENGSTFKLSGGTVKINQSNATAIYAKNGSDVEISGGKIELGSDAMYATAIEGEGIETEIQEGPSTEELNNTEQGVPSSILVSGGMIEVNSSGWGVSYSIASYGNVQITGGLITGYLGNIEIRSEESYNKIKKGTLVIDGQTTEDVNLIEDLTINISEKASGEIINGKINGKVENRGNLKISGGKVIYDYGRTISNTGDLEITKGEVEGDIAIDNGGNLIVGTNDGNVSKSEVIISGTTNGISNGNIFYFYDGSIKGKEKAISGTITSVENNYEIDRNTEGEFEVVTLREILNLAEVNGSEFKTLQEAINACNGSEIEGTPIDEYTIKILRNIEGVSSEQTNVIPEGKSVILDLRGNNISYSNNYFIDNRGILKIKDSSSTEIEQQGKIIGLANSCLKNENIFKLESGTIEINSRESTAVYATRGSNVEILGGKIKVNKDALKSKALEGEGKNEEKANSNILIAGGYIETNGESWTTEYAIYSCGDVKITNGDIKANNRNNYIEIDGFNSEYQDTGARFDIEGGNIQGLFIQINGNVETNISGGFINNEFGRTIYNSGNMKITGGTISSYSEDLSSYIENAISNEGTIEMIGGTVSGTSGIVNSGTLIVGQKGEEVSTEIPVIYGRDYGVMNYGIFNFYDGRIKGANNQSIYGVITNIEGGYKIQKTIEGEEEVATLSIIATNEAVVSVGTIYYMDLQTAINSATPGVQTNIKLLKDIALDKDIVIESDLIIELDLNGHTIDDNGTYNIVNNGSLNVIDSSNG